MEIVREEGSQNLSFISMLLPDDPHTHLRDGEMLADTVARSNKYFGRIMAMPNLSPPLVSVSLCHEYLKRVYLVRENQRKHFEIDFHSDFKVYTALYLTDQTTSDDIKDAAADDQIIAGKLYPAGATTGSSSGVSNLSSLDHVLGAMEQENLVLSIHGEAVGSGFDIFDRERIFVSTILPVIVKKFPNLRIVLEHVSTKEGVEFVMANKNVVATVTPQHITYTRTDMLANGMRSDLFCFPVLQTEADRLAVLKFATSGRPDSILGTDSAPHLPEKKQSGCAPGGFYNPNPLDLYIKAFESVGRIERFEKFASVYAAEFYGWELNTRTIALQRNENGIFVPRSDLQ